MITAYKHNTTTTVLALLAMATSSIKYTPTYTTLLFRIKYDTRPIMTFKL